MKREVDVMPQLLLTAYRILIVIAFVLVLAIILGTAVGLTARAPTAARPGAERTGGELGRGRSGGTNAGKTRQTAYFTGVGRLRAATADERPATVIVSIAFPYDRKDSAFSEELAAKTRDFREAATALLASHTAAQLRGMGEEELKSQILGRFNALLRLGKIETVYFNDYLIVD